MKTIKIFCLKNVKTFFCIRQKLFLFPYKKNQCSVVVFFTTNNYHQITHSGGISPRHMNSS